MTGQRERITFRTVVWVGRSGSFLPPYGVGYGLGEDLGLVLNRTVKGTSRFRTIHKVIVGTVFEETTEHVAIERDNGQRLRIPVKNIIERSKIS